MSTLSIIKKSPGSPKILIIYTGGTMGMVYDRGGTHLVPSDIGLMLSKLPELDRLALEISLLAWKQPIDSANMKPGHWQQLAKQIYEEYKSYDGFVIIHGTDTMAYSASALSFMLDGLRKPVIFTGAQVPMDMLRSDARDNLISSLYIAGLQQEGKAAVQEVCVFFENSLWRGNRVRKVQSNHFDAFISENYPSLAEAGVQVEINYKNLYRSDSSELKLYDQMCADIALLKLYPGITREQVKSIFGIKGIKGVVLESYGSGNMPTEIWFIQLLEEAVKEGIVIVNVSQCIGGKVVQGKYETSEKLTGIGIIGAGDMTTEAALVKLMFVLDNSPYKENIRKSISSSLRGELTASSEQ